MLENRIEALIDKVNARWAWAIFVIVSIWIAILIYKLYRDYVTNQLQNKWYAMAILQAQKEMQMADTSHVITDAMDGDKIVGLATNFANFA